jgi:hypothetical protein
MRQCDLLVLLEGLAETPCRPLSTRHVSLYPSSPFRVAAAAGRHRRGSDQVLRTSSFFSR